VSRRLWIDVSKRQQLIRLVDDICADIAGYDLAKKAAGIVHKLRPFKKTASVNRLTA
jgi:hypothetical protein